MTVKGLKGLEFAGSCWKFLDMAELLEWFEMAINDRKCFKMSVNVCKLLYTALNGFKQLKIGGIGWNWMENAGNG